MRQRPPQRELTERDRAILRDVIGTFILTGEPVSSRTVSRLERHGLSAASIRNVMADLEDLGFLTHPHTSAGRVPTGEGYHLYIESLMPNRKVTAKILERAGHKSHVVASGDDALDALDEQTFDLVLMDVNMPGTSGLDVVKLHRFAQLGGPRLPIVALTADATTETRKRCEEAGMDAYVTKPVESARLLAVIDSLVPEGETQETSERAEESLVTDIATHPRFHGEVEPVLDLRTLEELEELGSGSEFVTELISDFILDTEQLLREMEVAVATRDAGKFQECVHALRSSAVYVGALRLFRACCEVSGIGSDEFDRGGAGHVRNLNNEFARFRSELALHLADQRETRAPS